MSYDIQIAVTERVTGRHVRVDNMCDHSSPTYNLRDVFAESMGWDYDQGIWYPVSDVTTYLKHGIDELSEHGSDYAKYEPDNGWGTVEDALGDMRAWLSEIRRLTSDSGAWEPGWSESGDGWPIGVLEWQW